MDDERDLPPLPIRPPDGPVAESSRRHSHRSKDRNSTRDLTTLLLLEQHEHRETQRELSRVTEQLRIANLRAEEAQSQVREATERLKSVNEARLIAVREAARANESLGLYKFQLETAQNEIHRAQSVFNIVEKERYKAEQAGAKSRTAARKLDEQHKIYRAREEGRRLGLQEGLEAGRLNLFNDEPGVGPTPSNFAGTQIDDYVDDLGYEGFDSPGYGATDDEFYSPSPPRNAASLLPAANSRERYTPAPVPVPPPIPAPAPAPVPVTEPVPMTQPAPVTEPAATGPLSPLFMPFRDIHPTPVHNEAPHPRHEHVDVPPDGFIPQTGLDSFPQIPPPHEFIRQRDPSPPRNNGSVVEEPVITPSTFARAISSQQRNSPSQRAASVRAESVRRSAAGSVRPVQMPTPRMNTNILGMERQAQRSSRSSDFFGGGPPAQSPGSSGPVPITVMPPSEPESRRSSTHVPSPSMGSNLFGAGIGTPQHTTQGSPLPQLYIPTIGGPTNPHFVGAVPPGFVPSRFQAAPSGASPMPGGYAQPSANPGIDALYDLENDAASTHSSDFQISEPDTLTTPPETRRPHPHKSPRVKNPNAWPRDPGYVRPPKTAGPGFGFDQPEGSTSRT